MNHAHRRGHAIVPEQKEDCLYPIDAAARRINHMCAYDAVCRKPKENRLATTFSRRLASDVRMREFMAA